MIYPRDKTGSKTMISKSRCKVTGCLFRNKGVMYCSLYEDESGRTLSVTIRAYTCCNAGWVLPVGSSRGSFNGMAYKWGGGEGECQS